MSTFWVVLLIAAVAIIAYVLYRKFVQGVDSLIPLPIRELGFTDMPAVPLSIQSVLDTIKGLFEREKELKQAKMGLSKNYKIQGYEANAYSFLYGRQSPTYRQEILENLHEEAKTTRLANRYARLQ